MDIQCERGFCQEELHGVLADFFFVLFPDPAGFCSGRDRRRDRSKVRIQDKHRALEQRKARIEVLLDVGVALIQFE